MITRRSAHAGGGHGYSAGQRAVRGADHHLDRGPNYVGFGLGVSLDYIGADDK